MALPDCYSKPAEFATAIPLFLQVEESSMTASWKVRSVERRVASIHSDFALAISWYPAVWCLMGLWSCVYSQDPAVDRPEIVPAPSIAGLEQIRKDYIDFLAERTRLHDQYAEALDTLKNTEADLRRINNDGIQQQMMAMQSSMVSMRIAVALHEIGEDFEEEEELIRTKAIADLNTALRGEELRQLDSAAQAIVRRRIECLQKGFELQQQWLRWQKEWPKFMIRYWPHSDPERRFTRAEVESRLAILEKADTEDYAAAITAALLLDRLGKHEEAIARVNKVLQMQTAIQSTAMIARASILLSQNKGNAAAASLTAAAKSTHPTPFDRWLRARISASRKEYRAAESQWRSLMNYKPLELESRRGFALLYCNRSERNPANGKKAVQEAQIALDLEPHPDWFSHFVLSLALYADGQIDKASIQLDRAEKEATDENLELCHQLRESMRNRTHFAWDFLNTLSPKRDD